MIAADLFVYNEIKVFGLLTDLKSAWHFFWLEEGKKIMTVKMTHRNKALDFAYELADVYREQSKEVNLIGLQKVHHVKIQELLMTCEGEMQVINFLKILLCFRVIFLLLNRNKIIMKIGL